MTRAQQAAERLYNATPKARIHTHVRKSNDERRRVITRGARHWNSKQRAR